MNDDGPRSQLLSRKRAAEYLGISTRTFDRLRQERPVPAVRLGRRRKYLASDLEALIADCRMMDDGDE